MLAATARLASSAIRATCSPGRTPRHVSTALRAPGINSGCGEPNFIYLIVLEMRSFSRASVRVSLSFNYPLGRAKFCHEEQASRVCLQARILPDSLAELRGETRKAGTWPPPLVTLARPVVLRRGRKPPSRPPD